MAWLTPGSKNWPADQSPALSDEREDPERVLPQDPDDTQVWAEPANKVEAINTLAVPVVTYSFNIINWTLKELAKLATKIRKFLTTYKMNHPKSDMDRL